MKALLLAFFISLANYQIITSQYTSQVFQKQIINRPIETVIDNIAYPPNSAVELLEKFMYSTPNDILYRPVDNFVYSTPEVIVEPPCNNIVPVSPISPPGNTIMITDCTPSACQSLSDTIQLMIVCNLLQNTQGGREYALQMAGPVINQLISSPVFSCGCPNPIFSNIDALSNTAPIPTCSCQTCSGTVSSCPCQSCASWSYPTNSCPNCLNLVQNNICQKCSGPIPSCPCQACSAGASPICQKCSAPVSSCSCSAAPSLAPVPLPLPPAPSCSCQACKACPNSLNSILSSFLNFL